MPMSRVSRRLRLRPSPFFGAAALLILSLAGCSKAIQQNRHLARAQEYFRKGQDEQAEIEYLNVLQLDPTNAQAMAGLGLVYFDEGRTSRVFAVLHRANELQPGNPAVLDKLATIYLNAGEPAQARTDAIAVLAKKPNDADAPMILVRSSRNLAELQAAQRRLEALPAQVRGRAPILAAQGMANLALGHSADAEKLFEQARQADPKFVPAYLGLAGIAQARHDLAHAEQLFQQAVALTPIRSMTRVQYAQFELQKGDISTATKVLDEMVRQAPDCIPPQLMLARIDLAERHNAAAAKTIDAVLARDSLDPDALGLSAQVKLATGDAPGAVAVLQRAVSAYPQSAPLYFQLAQTYAAAGDLTKASTSYDRVLRLNPGDPAATLALARLRAQEGNLTTAIADLKQLVQKHPELPAARLQLADAYMQQNEPDEAVAVYRALDKAYPNNPPTLLLLGIALERENDRAAARSCFEHALRLAPTYLPPLEQLADLDLQDRRFADARQRVLAQVAKEPKSAGPYLILAKIARVQGDTKGAETMLEKAVALEPREATAYVLLAQLYLGTHQEAKALANLAKAHANDPKNPTPLMMIAVINDQQGNYPVARDYYEQVLKLDPQFSPALNNLAYLDSEHLNDLARAYQLAQRARQLLPDEPNTADTLGWILYKRGQYTWALSLLTESAGKLPRSPDVQFHLGMTYYMLGDETAATTALKRALALSGTFTGNADARHALQILAINPAEPPPADAPLLLAATAKRADPVALTRLGAMYERQAHQNKALAAYQAALKASPTNVHALLGLADVYRARHDLAKALPFAVKARQQASDNPDVARTLGNLELAAGNYAWAASLLAEAVTAFPQDATSVYRLAQAQYYAGQIPAAEASARAALGSGKLQDAADARQFLDFLQWADDGARARPAAIDAALKANAKDVPALMAKGSYLLHRDNRTGAIATYQEVLRDLPDFPPACRQLTLLLAPDPASDQETLALAPKAQAAYPDDAALAKAYGLVLFRVGKYQDAINVLGVLAQNGTHDPEVLYYLGLAQGKLNNRTASVDSLKRALELHLTPDLAGKARALIGTAK